MKKILTAVLLFAMIFTSIPTATFAAESNDKIEQTMTDTKTESGIVPYNMDVWSTNGLIYSVTANGQWINVTPGQGKNLKVHFYVSELAMQGLNFRIILSTSSGNRTIAHWTTVGHHWADVVTNTSSGTYSIYLGGPACINGAFYTEP